MAYLIAILPILILLYGVSFLSHIVMDFMNKADFPLHVSDPVQLVEVVNIDVLHRGK